MQPERTNEQLGRKGFSWFRVIGCLVVIIGVPYWLLYPVFRSARLAAIYAREEEYVRAADLALILQMDKHGDRYPDLSGDMVSTLRPFIKDPKVAEAMRDYVWNTNLSGKRENDLMDPASMWVVYMHDAQANRYVVGFADGHVRRLSPPMLTDVLKLGHQIEKEKPEKQKPPPTG